MRRYICWDLDETIGCLRPKEANLHIPGLPKERGLTRGIKGLLEGLRGQGYVNVITTAAPPGYAEDVLGKYGLGGHFSHIFDSSILLNGGLRKRYLPVALELGIRPYEAQDRMLVIGNTDRDGPEDLDLVFILHPMAIRYHASVVGTVISALGRHGSWWWGYEALLQTNTEKVDNGMFVGGLQTVDDVRIGVGRLLDLPWADACFEHLVLIAEAPAGRKSKMENEKEERATLPACSL